jgi:hypothetical protein
VVNCRFGFGSSKWLQQSPKKFHSREQMFRHSSLQLYNIRDEDINMGLIDVIAQVYTIICDED